MVFLDNGVDFASEVENAILNLAVIPCGPVENVSDLTKSPVDSVIDNAKAVMEMGMVA